MSTSLFLSFSSFETLILLLFVNDIETVEEANKSLRIPTDLCEQWVSGKRSLIVFGEMTDGRLLLLDNHYSAFLLPMSALVNVGANMFIKGAPLPYINLGHVKPFQLLGTTDLPPRKNSTGALLLSTEKHSNYFLRNAIGFLSEDGQSFAIAPVEGRSDNAVVYYPIIQDNVKISSRIFLSTVEQGNSTVVNVLFNGLHLQRHRVLLNNGKMELTFSGSLLFRNYYRSIDGGYFWGKEILFGFLNSNTTIRIWNTDLDRNSIGVPYRHFFKCDSNFFSDDLKVAVLVMIAVLCALILLRIVIRCFLGSSKSSEIGSSSSDNVSSQTTNSKGLLSMITSGAFASKSTTGGASRKLTASTDSKLTSSGSSIKLTARSISTTKPVRLHHSKTFKNAT